MISANNPLVRCLLVAVVIAALCALQFELVHGGTSPTRAWFHDCHDSFVILLLGEKTVSSSFSFNILVHPCCGLSTQMEYHLGIYKQWARLHPRWSLHQHHHPLFLHTHVCHLEGEGQTILRDKQKTKKSIRTNQVWFCDCCLLCLVTWARAWR